MDESGENRFSDPKHDDLDLISQNILTLRVLI